MRESLEISKRKMVEVEMCLDFGWFAEAIRVFETFEERKTMSAQEMRSLLMEFSREETY